MIRRLAALGLSALVGGSAAAADGDGRQRWVLAMGVHEGSEAQDRLRHAVADAARFVGVLEDLGGVDPARITLLEDPTRQAMRTALVDLAADLARARQAGVRPEVVVYYSGHSDERGLTPYGEQVAWSELRALIGALPADMRLVILDSCASGAFVRDKGGAHVEGFLDDRSNAVEGDVFLTSASADESAQESDRLGGSFFTHHLVAGLRGAADADGDRRVTLDEAYDYAYRQTVAVTELSWAGAQHPTYAIDVTGQGDVVLTDLADRSSVLVFDEGLSGEVSIRQVDGALISEVGKRGGQALTVAVPPGRYTLRLRQAQGAYRARVVLEEGTPLAVTAAMLDPISLTPTRLRGPSARRWTRTHRASAHLAPFVGTYGRGRDIRTAGVSINLFGAVHPELVGFAVGTGSYVQGDLDGVDLQVGLSLAEGRLRGWQVGVWTQAREVQGLQTGVVARSATDATGGQIGPLTWTEGRLHGFQVGAVNLVDGHAPEASSGFQANFLFGHVGGTFTGLQLGTINDAETMRGLQLGPFNVARELEGLQVGLVNIVTERSTGGETLGVINAVKDGYHAFELTTDALSPLSLKLKTGSRHLYSVFRFGWDPARDAGAGFTLGGGVGGHARHKRFVFDGDFTVMLDEKPFVEVFTTPPAAMFIETTLTPGVQLSEAFAVFAGGALGIGKRVDGQPAAELLADDLLVASRPLGARQTALLYGSWVVGMRVVF